MAREGMKVGDLVNNTHALDQGYLGIIIEVSKAQLSNPNGCPYKVHWFNPPEFVGDYSWNNERWLEKINESR